MRKGPLETIAPGIMKSTPDNRIGLEPFHFDKEDVVVVLGNTRIPGNS